MLFIYLEEMLLKIYYLHVLLHFSSPHKKVTQTVKRIGCDILD